MSLMIFIAENKMLPTFILNNALSFQSIFEHIQHMTSHVDVEKTANEVHSRRHLHSIDFLSYFI